jgi:DNA-binding NtrC family response regulator
MNKEPLRVSAETMAALRRHTWPGNVRELQNLIERSMIRSPGPELSVLPEELETPSRNRTAAPIQTLAEAERAYILEVLERVGWVVGGRNGAAARLGMPRTTLIHRMDKLGIYQRAKVAAADYSVEMCPSPDRPIEPAWVS